MPPKPLFARRKGKTMQSENRMFDDFVKMVNGFAGTMAGMGREAESSAREKMREWIGERRVLDGFEIVVEGTTDAADAGAGATEAQQWADAGATWWIESDWSTFDPAAARRRIEAGPPRT